MRRKNKLTFWLARFSIALGLIFAFFSSAPLHAGGNIEDNNQPSVILEIVLGVSKEGLADGRVLVEASIQNTSEQGINFLPWNTPFDRELNGRVFSIDTKHNKGLKELPYMGLMVKRLPAIESDYLDVEPSALVTNSLDVTKSYKFCANTVYVLSFEGVIVSRDRSFLSYTSAPITFNTGSHFAKCSQNGNYN